MSRFIALILIPLHLIMQPTPHVHAEGSAQEEHEHAHHDHVHLSAIWGGHSHHHRDHDHVHDDESAPSPVQEDEHPHGADAIYVGAVTAFAATGISLELVATGLQLGFTANRHGSLSASEGTCATPHLSDLTHVLGVFSDVPLFLQGGSFRT